MVGGKNYYYFYASESSMYSIILTKHIMAEKKSKLAVIKTKPTTANVDDFINAIENEQKRNDCFVLLKMMKKASKQEPSFLRLSACS